MPRIHEIMRTVTQPNDELRTRTTDDSRLRGYDSSDVVERTRQPIGSLPPDPSSILVRSHPRNDLTTVKDLARWQTLPLRWNGASIMRDVPNIEAYALEQYPNLAITAPHSMLMLQEIVERNLLDPIHNPVLGGMIDNVLERWPRFPAGFYRPLIGANDDVTRFAEVCHRSLAQLRPGFSGPGVGPRARIAGALHQWLWMHAATRSGVIDRTAVENGLGRFGRELFNSFSDPICRELAVTTFTEMQKKVPGGLDFLGLSQAEADRLHETLARVGALLEQAPETGREAVAFLRAKARQFPELAEELRKHIDHILAQRNAPRRKYPRATNTGLQRLIRFGVLPIVPRFSAAQPTFEEIEVTGRRSPEVLAQIIEAAHFPDSMPRIQAAIDLLPDGLLDDVQMVAVQHGLATQWPVLHGLEAKGLDPGNTQFISAPYSGSAVVQAKFRSAGYNMVTPLGDDPTESLEALERELDESLARAIERSLPGKPILVLDDGGHASRLIHGKYAKFAHRFRVVEQTTRGFRLVERMEEEGELGFVCASVARHPLKKYESRQVAVDSFANVNRSLDTMGMPPVWGQPFAVVGYGTIGAGMAREARDHDCDVAVWDDDPEVRAQARADGFFAPDDPAEVFAGRYVILGATGEPSIRAEQIAMMDHETVIGSVSSADVEIEDQGQRPDVESMVLSGQAPGDRRYVNRLWRFPDKDIVVLRNRFPVSFNGGLESGRYEGFEQTRSIMVLGILDAMTNDERGLRHLSDDIAVRWLLNCSDRSLSVHLPRDYVGELETRYNLRVTRS